MKIFLREHCVLITKFPILIRYLIAILWQLSAYIRNVNNSIRLGNCFCLQWDTRILFVFIHASQCALLAPSFGRHRRKHLHEYRRESQQSRAARRHREEKSWNEKWKITRLVLPPSLTRGFALVELALEDEWMSALQCGGVEEPCFGANKSEHFALTFSIIFYSNYTLNFSILIEKENSYLCCIDLCILKLFLLKAKHLAALSAVQCFFKWQFLVCLKIVFLRFFSLFQPNIEDSIQHWRRDNLQI